MNPVEPAPSPPVSRPDITVAVVVERDGKFLMVREESDGVVVLNQPAGHLERGETVFAAAQRETAEEAGWEIRVTALLGIYDYTAPDSGKTYIRHCFIAEPLRELIGQPLDEGILEALWLSYDEILADSVALRSPLVRQALQDYQSGIRYPLSVITLLDS
ncbi:MAG: NUDIX hydrolase [Gammaproteobacteria bacterium]